MFSFFFYSEPVIREYAHVYENTHRPHGIPVLLDDNTRIRSLEVADAYKEKQQAKFRRLKSKGRALLIGKGKVGVTATAFAMKSPVEQLPRRACAAGLTDSCASRATRATRGDAHPARQSRA